MINVILDCEIGKWAHRYRPLIKYSRQEVAEKTGFPRGYPAKVKPSGNARRMQFRILAIGSQVSLSPVFRGGNKP